MRRLAFALLLVCSFGTLASAQTVIVTHAPAGATVEVVLNTDRVGTATADAQGLATITFGIPAQVSEIDVHISTERCGDTRRVLLVERGVTGAPPTGPCDRRDFPDTFVVQRITNFVVDFTNAVPSVHLRQGPVPETWLSDEGGTTSTGKSRFAPSPKGLMVSGGIGFASANSWHDLACGTNTTTCTSTGVTRALTGTVSFWLTPNIGAEASYLHPSDITASGNGDDYTFSSTRTTDVLLLGGVAGGSVGGVRIYGRGGATYHRATMTTSETITNVGSQNFELKTEGWSWYGGGGVEIWLKPFLAVYIDGGAINLRGGGVGGANGEMDETIIAATVGARVHLWK
jgi:hypothetical protein